MPSFRFQARYALLTYAQSGDLDPHEIVCHLSGLGGECIVGREDHEDGGVHFHAFVDFEHKFRTRDVRAFDVGGRHPNIVSSWGTPEKGWDYATKDGDIVGGGLLRPDNTVGKSKGCDWSAILSAETREDFFARLEEHNPRALVTSFGSVKLFADWRFRVERGEYCHPGGISFEGVPSDMVSWVDGNIGGRSELGINTLGEFFHGVSPPWAPRGHGEFPVAGRGPLTSRPMSLRFAPVSGLTACLAI